MLESEAKLMVQEAVRNGACDLVWSYILDYENSKNPFEERREQIAKWRTYAAADIEESAELLDLARGFRERGIKRIDALHLACAVHAGADRFLTTDDGILKRAALIPGIGVTDPIGFIKEVFP
jgi:hypothetical protein